MHDRRLQILLDESRYRRIVAEAKARRTSVAAVIRDAIDRAFPVDLAEKRRAADELLAAEPIELPDDPVELKREIREARERGL
jgi:hypothetical protein